MSGELTPREALTRLGASTAEAIAQVLEMFAPGLVERGDVTVLPDTPSAFSSLTRGSVVASVSYVDGVTGGNIFVLSLAGAHKLATGMGVPAPEDPEAELSELELSAVSEASNQMMASAAAAVGVVLGQEIEISPPETRVVTDPSGEADHYDSSPHVTSTTFLIGGESCRLIQLVPSAFLVRMARALDELGSELSPAGDDSVSGAESQESVGLVDALERISLRVWAELGRTRLPLGKALSLPRGALVELDQAAQAPVDLYVNGVRFAQGRLTVTDDGEWAFSLDELCSCAVTVTPSTDTLPPLSNQPTQGAVN